MPSLVGSEMCIRDSRTTAGISNNIWRPRRARPASIGANPEKPRRPSTPRLWSDCRPPHLHVPLASRTAFPLRAPPVRTCFDDSARRRRGQAPPARFPGCGRKGDFFCGAFPARPRGEFPTGTPSTGNAACTLPFAPPDGVFQRHDPPNWPDDLSTHVTDKYWRGHPSLKRDSRVLDLKNRREYTSTFIGRCMHAVVARNSVGTNRDKKQPPAECLHFS